MCHMVPYLLALRTIQVILDWNNTTQIGHKALEILRILMIELQLEWSF